METTISEIYYKSKTLANGELGIFSPPQKMTRVHHFNEKHASLK